MSETPARTNIEEIKNDPAKFYHLPEDIVADQSLSHDDKVDMLRHWEMDARLMAVAEEENMPGDEESPLRAIHRALLALQATTGDSQRDCGSNPSKSGG